MEPISINLGVLIPEREIIQRVRDLCRRYGTLFVADEVACGFGRTGRVFACEHFDLRPDMLCVAKAMSGGLAPVGAMIATLRSLKANRVRLLSQVAAKGATGCSCRPRARRCCCSRRWQSTSGPPPEGWTFWRARYECHVGAFQVGIGERVQSCRY
jgi:hypothetical protein